MTASDIHNYIDEQLQAGYSIKEVREALRNAGWEEDEIEKAIPREDEVNPPVKISPPINWGFFLAIVGGIIILGFSAGTIMNFQIIATPVAQGGLSIGMFGLITGLLETSFNAGIIALLFSVVIILGSFLSHKEEKEQVGGIMILVFSLIILIGFNGILPLFGSILAIGGAILSIRRGLG